jgi:glucosamine--fructose-6-phosphate aminotransferase (isomerizing)
MCGIIARISTNSKENHCTLHGLKELEYRGYDSYGIVFWNQKTNSYVLKKDIGCISEKDLENYSKFESNIEVAHTRWATHGGVSKINAHPHVDTNNRFFVVMNGIIENYDTIIQREQLKCKTETDTEVLPLLFAKYYCGDLLKTAEKILKILKGEFSFVVLHKNSVVVYKNMNPILIGFNDDSIFVSSDFNSIQKYSTSYMVPEDFSLSLITLTNKVSFTYYQHGKRSTYKKFKRKLIEESVEKPTKYYMEKEILEQKNLSNFLTSKNISHLEYLSKQITKKQVFLLGAGSSYHAALYLHYRLLEKNIFSTVILASELHNYIPLLSNSLLVVFSQSGETADLIHPLKQLQKTNEIFAVVNTPNSTLDRFASHSVYLHCGKEIAVASTKAFLFQIFVGMCVLEILENKKISKKKVQLFQEVFDTCLSENLPLIKKIAQHLHNTSDIYYIGRNKHVPLALEGALKLKEISYIHAEGFAGGELKHGSLALITQNVPVVSIGNESEIISNAIETKTRGGVIIGVSSKYFQVYDYWLKVPEIYSDLFTTIVLQLLAFEITILKGYNPDKPRNLAKSVTVK